MNFTSNRLDIAEISVTDMPYIHRLHACEEVAAFNTIGVLQSLSETEKLLNPEIGRAHV